MHLRAGVVCWLWSDRRVECGLFRDCCVAVQVCTPTHQRNTHNGCRCSHYRKVLGSRFLPAAVPFVQTDEYPGLRPAREEDGGEKCFADMFTTQALYTEAASIPRETFLPRRKGVDFDELRCPFGCHTIFVTKAAFRRHRVRMHKFRRAPKDKPEEKFESFSLTDDINHIIRRTNSTSNEFVVQTVNDAFEWWTLPLELPIVRTFWRRKKAPPMAWSCQKTFLR